MCAIYPNIVIVSAVRKANICTFTHIILTQRASLSFVIYGFGWKCGVVFFSFSSLFFYSFQWIRVSFVYFTLKFSTHFKYDVFNKLKMKYSMTVCVCGFRILIFWVKYLHSTMLKVLIQWIIIIKNSFAENIKEVEVHGMTTIFVYSPDIRKMSLINPEGA